LIAERLTAIGPYSLNGGQRLGGRVVKRNNQVVIGGCGVVTVLARKGTDADRRIAGKVHDAEGKHGAGAKGGVISVIRGDAVRGIAVRATNTEANVAADRGKRHGATVGGLHLKLRIRIIDHVSSGSVARGNVRIAGPIVRPDSALLADREVLAANEDTRNRGIHDSSSRAGEGAAVSAGNLEGRRGGGRSRNDERAVQAAASGKRGAGEHEDRTNRRSGRGREGGNRNTVRHHNARNRQGLRSDGLLDVTGARASGAGRLHYGVAKENRSAVVIRDERGGLLISGGGTSAAPLTETERRQSIRHDGISLFRRLVISRRGESEAGKVELSTPGDRNNLFRFLHEITL